MSERLEDYLDFLGPDDIRIKGTRVGIETVIRAFRDGHSPEMIQQTYPTLTLEQVYAAILYYLHNKEAVSAYFTDWLEHGRRAREEQQRHPSPLVEKLRQFKAERDTTKVS